jgi:uncharacterized protein (TIGR03083 family)
VSGTREVLLAELRAERKRVERTFDELGADAARPPEDGGWSPKDVLAHLIGWNDAALQLLGRRPRVSEWPGQDGWNQRSVERYAALPIEAVRAAYAAVNDELQHEVARSSDEELTRTGRFEFSPTATAADAVRSNATDHWRLHLKELRVSETRPV